MEGIRASPRPALLAWVAVVILATGALPGAWAREGGTGLDIAARFGGVYHRPLNQAPSTLDPALTTDVYANTIVNQLFDGLLQFDRELNPTPAIAEFWEASPDGLTWTFHLRHDVEFHNGREITADDVVYSFTRILEPGLDSPAARFFTQIRGAREYREGKAKAVEGLRAVDRYKVQITLRENYTPFLSILAMVNAKIVPREAVQSLGEQFGKQPVGSGPFEFESWSDSNRIVLRAYKYYYEGRPFLDEVVFDTLPEGPEALERFLRGEFHETVISGAQSMDTKEDPRFARFHRVRVPGLHLLYVGFNTRREPFDNPLVRQALSYAINRDAIVREIRGGDSVVANAILPRGMPGYDPDFKPYYFNPDRARQLLREAGIDDGAKLPKLELWYVRHEERTRRQIEAYRDYLADVGVKVEIHEAENWSTFKEALEAGRPSLFQLAWYADIPDPDNFFYPLLHSQSKTNRTFYRNPRVDAMLDAARGETQYLSRISLYQQVERLVMKDAPWISQSHRIFEVLYAPDVRGIEFSALGPHYVPMKKIWLERAQ